MDLWRVRRYEPEDDAGIDRLLKLSLPGYAGRAKWEWVHKKNPLGYHAAEGDIWVAEGPGKSIVGYYGKIRYRMRCFGEEVLGAQALNMATHPDFRRKGLGTELILSSLRDSRRNGFKLIFGFPNASSYPIAVKIGAADAGPASALLLVLDPGTYFAQAQGSPIQRAAFKAGYFLRGIGFPRGQAAGTSSDSEIQSGLAEATDSVGEGIVKKFDVALVRSREYLEWRYAPQWGDYNIVSIVKGGESQGYAVTSSHTRGALKGVRLLEFVARDDTPKMYDLLLANVLRKARLQGSTHLTVSATTTGNAAQSLQRQGFRPTTKWARFTLFAYEPMISARLAGSRVYHSFGDRDYM